MNLDTEANETFNQLFQKVQLRGDIKTISQQHFFDEKISVLQTYQNLLYIATNQSKVMVFEIVKTINQPQSLNFVKITQFYPHCSQVGIIKAAKQLLVIVPSQEQQIIGIWDRQKCSILQGFKGHSSQITSVLFLKDKKHLASVSHDSTARIWNICEPKKYFKQKIIFQSKYSLISIQQIDEDKLALGGDDCCITVWNWQKCQVQCIVFGHPGSVYSLSLYSPFLVSSGGDSKIKIWSIKKQIMQTSSKSLSQITFQKKQELNLIKQIIGQVGQRQFFFKMPNYKMLIMDSSGKASVINDKFVVNTFKLQIQYFENIVSAQVWEDNLFVIYDSNKIKKNAVKIVKLGQQKEDQLVDSFYWSEKEISSIGIDRGQQKKEQTTMKVFTQQQKKPQKYYDVMSDDINRPL